MTPQEIIKKLKEENKQLRQEVKSLQQEYLKGVIAGAGDILRIQDPRNQPRIINYECMAYTLRELL